MFSLLEVLYLLKIVVLCLSLLKLLFLCEERDQPFNYPQFFWLGQVGAKDCSKNKCCWYWSKQWRNFSFGYWLWFWYNLQVCLESLFLFLLLRRMTDTVQIWGRVNILLLVTFCSKPDSWLETHQLEHPWTECRKEWESFQVCMSGSNLGKWGKNIVLV